MKKFISLLCALTLMCSMIFMAGCGDNTTSSTETPASTETSTETSVEPAPAATVYDAADLYSAVWASYADDEKYPVAGGDYDVANMDAPDKFDVVANRDTFVYTFLVPDEMVDQIDGDVISAMHMMNTNTFCSAMFALKDASNADSFAESYKQAVQGNEWMCGFPDTVVVLSCNNVIIIAYGEDEMIQTFKNKCTALNGDMKILVDAPALEG